MTIVTPDANSVIGTNALARMFGVTEESIRQLTGRGILRQIPNRRGKYNLIETVNAYTSHLREQAAGRATPEKLAQAKLLKATADANKAVIQTKQLQGELLPASKIENEWASIMRVTATSMRALPSRIANRLNLSNESKAIVADEIDTALNDLADNGTNYTEQIIEDESIPDSNEQGEEDSLRSLEATTENENVRVRTEANSP